MKGFGKGFKEKKYTGKITHSTNLEGLYRLFNCFNVEEPVCFSTYGTIDRGIELVYEVVQMDGMYTDYDADAGRNFGWDEFRSFATEEMIQNPVAIKINAFSKEWIFCETEEVTEEQEEAYGFFEDFRLLQIIE